MTNIQWFLPLSQQQSRVFHSQEQTVGYVHIPLLGQVSAGVPIDIYEQQETVQVPSQAVPTTLHKETYALKVKGNSMIDDGIEDGDIIVVKKQVSAENGQTVVAMINGETTTLKRFYVEADGIRLQPANSKFNPLFLQHGEVEILGIVESIIRYPQ